MFAKINLRLCMKVLFLFCLMVSPAFGQSLITYSDTWMDDESGFAANPENAEVYIIGSGVAEIDPKSDYHTVNTQVTITSPNGRTETASGTWTQKSEGTSITVTVPILVDMDSEPADTGNYESLVIHIPTCPESHSPTGGGSTFPVGITYIAMQLALPPNLNVLGYLYEKVQPCDVYCGAPLTNRYDGRPSACIQLQIPFGPFGCSILVRVVKNAQACICFDVGYN